jgi:uncharacterized HAD superfamily protein
LKIGIDIDGVLANFNSAYIRLLGRIGGKYVDTSYQPTQWSYETDLGFDGETVHMAWEEIKKGGFWYSLDPLADVLDLPDICEDHDVYFITQRPGKYAKLESEDWLREHYGVDVPTVLITESGKGPIVKALDLDLFIDDRDKNILDVRRESPRTHCFIVDRPYNRTFDDLAVTRAKEIGDALAGL